MNPTQEMLLEMGRKGVQAGRTDVAMELTLMGRNMFDMSPQEVADVLSALNHEGTLPYPS